MSFESGRHTVAVSIRITSEPADFETIMPNGRGERTLATGRGYVVNSVTTVPISTFGGLTLSHRTVESFILPPRSWTLHDDCGNSSALRRPPSAQLTHTDPTIASSSHGRPAIEDQMDVTQGSRSAASHLDIDAGSFPGAYLEEPEYPAEGNPHADGHCEVSAVKHNAAGDGEGDPPNEDGDAASQDVAEKANELVVEKHDILDGHT